MIPGSDYIVTVLFGLMVALTAAGALLAVLSTRIIRSVSGLAVCCLGLAGLYCFLNSPFLALMEILIYIGAVCVAIVFGIMLTSRAAGPRLRPRGIEVAAGGVVFILLLAGLTAILTHAKWGPTATEQTAPSVADLGRALLGPYLVLFELVSVLLLAVMIGAAYLALPEATKRYGTGSGE